MGMRIGTEMPRLEGATEWIGGTQVHAEMEAKGHPTLVHFWSMSCGMCKENMPRIAEWREGLKNTRARVLAVHMPRYETIQTSRVLGCYCILNHRAVRDRQRAQTKDAFRTIYVPAWPFDGEELRSRSRGTRPGFTKSISTAYWPRTTKAAKS